MTKSERARTPRTPILVPRAHTALMASSDAASLKEAATALYRRGEWAAAADAYDDARRAESSSTSPDASTLAILHANKSAALLAHGGRDREACAEAIMAVMLDESYARARQRVGSACVRLGIPAVIDVVPSARASLDSAYAFHRQLRERFDGTDAKLLAALRRADAARAEGNDAFGRGELDDAAAAYTRALDAPCPYGGGTRSGGSTSLVVGGGVLLCDRAAARAALGDHRGAFDDATAALRADDNYVKARRRACDALIALGRGDDAMRELRRLRADVGGGGGGAEERERLRAMGERAAAAARAERASADEELIRRSEKCAGGTLPPEYEKWAVEKKKAAGGGGRKRRRDDDGSESDSSSSSSSSSSSGRSREKKRKKEKKTKKKTKKKREKSSKSSKKKRKR